MPGWMGVGVVIPLEGAVVVAGAVVVVAPGTSAGGEAGASTQYASWLTKFPQDEVTEGFCRM
jgi:hypothetical protein